MKREKRINMDKILEDIISTIDKFEINSYILPYSIVREKLIRYRKKLLSYNLSYNDDDYSYVLRIINDFIKKYDVKKEHKKKHTLGCEFEFNVINREGDYVSRHEDSLWITAEGWGYQNDPTCTVELRSPIFTNMNEMVDELKKQFRLWLQENPTYSPYPFNHSMDSIGTHIHVGTRDNDLSFDEKIYISKAVANVYPFLAALHAAPLPSLRGMRGEYCRPIYYYNFDIPATEHYAEISDSSHGTIEFRLFDANIPQVTLTVSWILKAIADKIKTRVDINTLSYQIERKKALTRGLKDLNVKNYITYIYNLVGNLRIPDISCIKEILYLSIAHKINPWEFIIMNNVRTKLTQFKVLRKMYFYPDEFIANLPIPQNSEFYNIHNEINKINTIKDLLDIIKKYSKERITYTRIGKYNIGLVSRTNVREKIYNNQYEIVKATDIKSMSKLSIVKRIHYLQKIHGENMVNVMNIKDIMKMLNKFYMFCVNDECKNKTNILGVICVDYEDSVLRSLVVDRRYRKLGIGSILIQYGIKRLNGYGRIYIRKNNEYSQKIIEKMGFIRTREYPNSYEYVYRRGL